MEKVLLKVHEACDMTGLGRSLMYDMVARGEIGSVRVGRAVRIPVSALNAWIQKNYIAGQVDCNTEVEE